MVEQANKTYNTRMMSSPIRHNKSLEAELAFKEMVESVAVGTPIRVVDLVVTAHHGSRASTDGISERPEVQLVHSHIIDVGGDGVGDVVSVAGRFNRLTEVFLLVGNEVLA